MNDLISVIIPVYKVEKWIEKCVDSVLAQTYGNLEIILVDDGSPDRCSGICDVYGRKDPRIRVIHKSNGGLSSARNAGLDIAAGKYIVFVDSDDYIHPQMIEKMYGTMEENQADLVICGLQRVDEEGIETSGYRADFGLAGTFNKDEIFEKMCGIYWVYCVASWNKMYHRKLWDSYRYPEGKLHEDEFAIRHILDQCGKVVCIDKSYYYYVQREGSIMAEKSVGQLLDALEACLEQQAYYEQNEMTDCMFMQDRRCFGRLREIYCSHPEGRDRERYRRYKTEYYQLHSRVVKWLYYPALRRAQVALYLYFPRFIVEAGNCCRKIKSSLGKGGAEK